MDYQKIYNESTPVGERDELRAWKQQQAEEEKWRKARMGMEASCRGLERQAQKAVDILGYFLGADVKTIRVRSDYKVHSRESASLEIISNNEKGEIAWTFGTVNQTGVNIDLREIQKYIRYYFSTGCSVQGDGLLHLTGRGKREKCGPLAGKLKKAGLNVSYSIEDNKASYCDFYVCEVDIKIEDLEDMELFNDCFGGNGKKGLEELANLV